MRDELLLVRATANLLPQHGVELRTEMLGKAVHQLLQTSTKSARWLQQSLQANGTRQLGKTLASGSRGLVYQIVTDEHTDREVLKTPLKGHTTRVFGENVASVIAEWTFLQYVTSQIGHSCMPAYTDVVIYKQFAHNGRKNRNQEPVTMCAILMENMQTNGTTLFNFLRTLRHEQTFWIIVHKLVLLIRELWMTHGFAHGDLSLTNIIVCNPDNASIDVRLVDYGWSQLKLKESRDTCLYQRCGQKVLDAMSLEFGILRSLEEESKTNILHKDDTLYWGHACLSSVATLDREICIFWANYMMTYTNWNVQNYKLVPDTFRHFPALHPKYTVEEIDKLRLHLARVCNLQPPLPCIYEMLFRKQVQQQLSGVLTDNQLTQFGWCGTAAIAERESVSPSAE